MERRLTLIEWSIYYITANGRRFKTLSNFYGYPGVITRLAKQVEALKARNRRD